MIPGLRIWQPLTYLFLHADLLHIILEHVGAVELWQNAGAGVGNATISELFFYLRRWRGID